MKGDISTHMFSKQGKENYGLILKSCGCQLGEKCNCSVDFEKLLANVKKHEMEPE